MERAMQTPVSRGAVDINRKERASAPKPSLLNRARQAIRLRNRSNSFGKMYEWRLGRFIVQAVPTSRDVVGDVVDVIALASKSEPGIARVLNVPPGGDP